MTLTAYVIDGHQITIRPAPVDRHWMEESDRRFAYRCLPLNIANTHGWRFSAHRRLMPCGKGDSDLMPYR